MEPYTVPQLTMQRLLLILQLVPTLTNATAVDEKQVMGTTIHAYDIIIMVGNMYNEYKQIPAGGVAKTDLDLVVPHSTY